LVILFGIVANDLRLHDNTDIGIFPSQTI